MAEFTLKSQTLTADSALTTLAGEMNDASFDMVQEEFGRVLDSGVTGLVLDISSLDTVTSACLGAVLELSRLLAERGGGLVVVAAESRVMEILELLGLRESLTFADTVETAKKNIASVARQASNAPATDVANVEGS